MKRQAIDKKYSQCIYLTNDSCPEYTKNSYKSIRKTINCPAKNGLKDLPGGPWLRIHLPMQRTWVRSLVQNTAHAQGNQAHEPQLLSLHSRAHSLQPLKPAHPRAHAPQQEMPPTSEKTSTATGCRN